MLNKPSDFSRRLRLFGFGFLIGCILVYFILLKGKDRTGWLPERRIIDGIDTTLIVSSKTKCWLDCNNLSEKDLHDIIKDSDVNFKESSPHAKPFPIYVLTGKLPAGEEVRMQVAMSDSHSTLNEFSVSYFQNKRPDCPCDSVKISFSSFP